MASRTPRKTLQATETQALVASMYLRGMTQAAIAKELGCTRPNVTQHLSRVRKVWLDSSLQDFNELKARELARLDEIERQAWIGWERSLKDGGFVQKKGVGMQCACLADDFAPDPGCEDCGGTGQAIVVNGAEVTEKRHGRDGNPKFLEIVGNCVAKRCEILGLDSPKTIRFEEVDRVSDRLADLIVAFVPEGDQDAALRMLSDSTGAETVH